MNTHRTILMLEDDPDDRFITAATIRELGYPADISYVATSDELFTFLEKESKPFLILLDFNAVPMGAVEILGLLKDNDRYRYIPVVVLGDSDSSKYVHDCYTHGASTYIKKPSTPAGTAHKIRVFFEYWLSVAAG